MLPPRDRQPPPRAVITGASGGIGRALAVALAARGLRCVLVGRSRAALAELAATLPAPADIRVADLADAAEVEALAASLAAGPLDVLVHSAGLLEPGGMGAIAAEALDRMHAVNVRAPCLLTRGLLPALRAARGQVVFINSSAALRAAAAVAGYAATKAALKALADGLRDEVNADGVRVVSLYPGRTASAMQEALHRMEGRAYTPERLLQPEDVAAAALGALEMPRTAEVTDVHIRPLQKA